MDIQKRGGPRPLDIFGAALLALAIAAAALLTSRITLYCDDYFYGTFFRDGLKHFWELTRWHYNSFNGRAFVHFLAELTLTCDTKLFTVLNPLMLFAVFFVGVKAQSGGTPFGLRAAAAAVGMGAVLALPVQFLNASLLWISASFNYLFPVCLICVTLALYQRDAERGTVRPGTCVLALLCGATTEQSGAAAIVILGLWGLLNLIRKKFRFGSFILPLLLSCAGYASVILAPGTWVRVGHESGGGLLKCLEPEVFKLRFGLAMRYMTGENGLVWLFPAFAALAAVHASAVKKNQWLLAAGYPAAAGYLALFYTGHYTLAEIISTAYFLYAAVVYICRRDSTARGLMLLGMLAAQLVMITNTSADYRTAFPAILLLLTACASLLAELAEKLPAPVSAAALAAASAACFILFLPTFRGYAANAGINAKNLAAMRNTPEGGTVTLNLDYLDGYRYKMYFESDYYMQTAAKYYRLSGKKISYSCKKYQVLGLSNGSEYTVPAVKSADGTLYFPISGLATLLGGDGEWSYSNDAMMMWFGGKCCLVRTYGRICLWDKASDKPLAAEERAKVLMPWYTYYVDAEKCAELMGVTWSFDSKDNICYVSAGNG